MNEGGGEPAAMETDDAVDAQVAAAPVRAVRRCTLVVGLCICGLLGLGRARVHPLLCVCGARPAALWLQKSEIGV